MLPLIYKIDGQNFSDLEGFFKEIWRLIVEQPYTGQCNLDALNDIFSWPILSNDEPYELVWLNSKFSRQRLGHAEIARKLEQMLRDCHPSNRSSIEHRIEQALKGDGPTMFDWLVEIIRDNQEYVTLRLE